jgi:hypothetical protein
VIGPPGNRGVLWEQMTAPFNAPADPRGAGDGRVRRAFTAEMGRQPSYEENAQIMSGYTPEQVLVISGAAGRCLRPGLSAARHRARGGDPAANDKASRDPPGWQDMIQHRRLFGAVYGKGWA